MKTEKKTLDELSRLILLLDKELLELCNGHFKKAVHLIENKLILSSHLVKKIENLHKTIRALDRDLKLKNRSDKKYYQKLIATSINDLKEIYDELSEKKSRLM